MSLPQSSYSAADDPSLSQGVCPANAVFFFLKVSVEVQICCSHFSMETYHGHARASAPQDSCNSAWALLHPVWPAAVMRFFKTTARIEC